MDNFKPGPLGGVRIVEFDAIGPVPLAGMILSDLGCDVIRIVRPGGVGMGGAVLDRGKAMLALDLKDPAAIETALALIGRSDALIEGLRPGVMERLGLGPEQCLARNPRLAYGRMTGWGQTGPLAAAAGHDICYIALTGALHAIGGKDAPPTVPLNLIGDYGGGAMFLALGALAAILSARATGRGQVVDAAMTDGTAVLMSMIYALEGAGHWRDQRQSNLLDGGAPFYRCYACADGKHVAVGALEPQFFALLIAGLGFAPDCFDQNDRAGWPAMERRFAEAFATRSRDEWAAAFAGTDACVAPVLSMTEAPSHPHNLARRTFAERGGIAQPMPAPRFSETPGAAREPSVIGIEEALTRWAG